MTSDGRYMYYSDYPPYAAPPSYQPQRPIRSDSGSSSSQPPHSPEQQNQHHSSQQQFSNHNHSRPQPSYGPPPQQQYAPAPTYMSPAAPAPPQQWPQDSWAQSYAPPPPPPETQQYNTAPPPPARPASNDHQQRTWNHPSYPPPPPPPPESHHYSPPTRPRSDEPPQRVYAPPPLPPPDSPNIRQSHGRGQPPSAHPSYHQPPSHPQPPTHHQPHPHPSPPQATSQRIRRRRESTPPPPPPPAIVPEPTPEPVAYAPYSSPAANAIDFNKLMDSYRPILQAGRTLAAPRAAPDSTVDSMLENAFYAAQVLEGASSGGSHATQYQHRTQPPVVRGSPPVTVQQPPPMQHPYQQLQRVHSASTASSGSDIARPPSQLPPTTRSPPSNPRAKNLSPREVKANIKIDSPVNGSARGTPGLHGHTHIGGFDGAPTMSSSPSKPSKSQKLDGSAVADAGIARAQDTHHSGGTSTQKCLGCGATATPEWRRGPLGPRTLCNACGLVYAKLVKKRLRESGGGGRVANGYSSRSGPNPREESLEAGSDEDDEERSYDHANMPGR
ncbi:hypothetical protein B0H16DRAFT_950579 [Mycena metata]|uniref:GATA-type domain-containing protein n=1 Tax=Mycena metata TaxID=1033252 RepID=A0AAD7K307_9AGAR|nr:hypothetical protein B0H16DRAFT_950579 [Mycena metata]